MTSTELKIGLNNSTRPSSRVLKPPGGGHTNIFSEPEVSVNAPRPKYNQQNSSNLNACMGSTDANKAVEKLREEVVHHQQKDEQTKSNGDNKSSSSSNGIRGGSNNNQSQATSGGNNDAPRGRVPPGGYSSGGFW